MNKKIFSIMAALALSVAILGPMAASAQTTTPAISSITPSTASTGGSSMNITINGSNFQDGSTVKMGNTELTTIYVSASQLIATVPAAELAISGTKIITVENPDGSSSNGANFTVSTAGLPDTGVNEGSGFNLTALLAALALSALLILGGVQLKKAFSRQ